MGWLSDLFSSFDNQRARKGQALSSTHEAFSLPTSSPVLSTHPDAFNPDAFHTPDIESATSPAYTYPPQSKGAYGYITSPMTSRQGSSLLPTHMDSLHTPLSPQGLYPPLIQTWNRLRAWLNREYPELGDTLNYGILPQNLAEIEMQFGFALPSAVRESYLCVDGQEAESAAGCAEGLFFGLTFLPLENVLEEWRFWREVDQDSATGANPQLRELMQSIPPDWIRKEYSNRGWIPLIADKAGNYVGIDLNPAEQGSVGQVIIFGRDFDTKVVLWNGDGPGGWGKWLSAFADELESGEGFEIGANDNSEGSEDEIGYEDYYHDGHGHGAGDSGGDAGGGGGLRYTGEYRSWSVLEAWGDRSLRKWHEAGLFPDLSLHQDEELVRTKASENIGLGVLDLTHDSGAEVPIPVLAEDEAIPPPPPKPSTSSHAPRTQSQSQSGINVPTISVTKPPAPRPVELPTQHEIDSSSPPESLHSTDDLEAGRNVTMRELHEDIGLVSSTRKTPQQQKQAPPRRETSDTVGSALPMSPSPALEPSTSFSTSQSSSSPPSSSSAPIIPDLLAESTPAIGPLPIQPSSSQSLSESSVLNGTSTSDSASVDESSPEISQETPETSQESAEPEPITTVRLIGGGGKTGLVSEDSESPVEIEAPETAEPTAVTSEEPATEDAPNAVPISEPVSSEVVPQKVHKKTKSSLASLKKLGLGLRKDSSASVKEVASSTAQ